MYYALRCELHTALSQKRRDTINGRNGRYRAAGYARHAVMRLENLLLYDAWI